MEIRNNKSKRIVVALLAVGILPITFASCKKKSKVENTTEPYVPFLAPCIVPENTMNTSVGAIHYIGDSVSTVPNVPIDDSHYMITKTTSSPDSTMYLYFMQEPQTGVYYPQPGLHLELPNAIIIRHTYVNFSTKTWGTDSVFVDNHGDSITVSFCHVAMGFENMPGSTSTGYHDAKIKIHK